RSDVVVLLSDPRMSLVSMANSGGISKRPILPAAKEAPASTRDTTRPRECEVARRRARWPRSPRDSAHHPWRDCTRLRIGGGQAHGDVIANTSRPGAVPSRSDTHSAPAVGG